MAADDVHLRSYDPRWPELFRAEAERLRHLLGNAVVNRIEHVGSTAVPRIIAKPVIDMLVEIPSFKTAERDIVPTLREEGWEYIWRDDRPPGHMMFIRRASDGRRTHHVHMAPAGHSLWERVLFRDYLRSHPQEASRYEQLKIRLASLYAADSEAYTEAKGAYVKEIMMKATARP
jgi:GrpB-like predicted nucleotidyltransferase (UPF0157 family)